jgi:hypothetical protein
MGRRSIHCQMSCHQISFRRPIHWSYHRSSRYRSIRQSCRPMSRYPMNHRSSRR